MELREQHVLACSFPSWYDTFKAHTIPSVIIPLSDEFVKFLHADGVYVPDRLLPKHTASGAELAYHDSDDDREWAAAKAKATAKRQSKKEAKAKAAAAAAATGATAPATGGAAPPATAKADDSDSDDEIDEDVSASLCSFR